MKSRPLEFCLNGTMEQLHTSGWGSLVQPCVCQSCRHMRNKWLAIKMYFFWIMSFTTGHCWITQNPSVLFFCVKATERFQATSVREVSSQRGRRWTWGGSASVTSFIQILWSVLHTQKVGPATQWNPIIPVIYMSDTAWKSVLSKKKKSFFFFFYPRLRPHQILPS